MNINASRTTFLPTWVELIMVVTHFLNPIDGVASGTRPLSGNAVFDRVSAYSIVSDVSNQNKQVISAANSAKLPLLLLTDSGICK